MTVGNMTGLLILCACCILQLTAANNWEKYVGYYDVSATPVQASDVEALKEIQWNNELTFLEDPSGVGRQVRLLVSPEKVGFVKNRLDDIGMYANIVEFDTTPIREEWERLSKRDRQVYNYADFNDYQNTVDEIDAIAARCSGDLVCETSTIGNSLEGRPIRMLTIKRATNNRAFWMDSAIHAREWLSPSTTMNIINDFVTGYPDGENSALMASFNWYYVPQMNPDGYEFTWTDDRFWRKNRRDNVGSACFGVDLNRNYDSNWGWLPGASNNPCSDTFFGSSAGSEPETAAVESALLAIPEVVEAFWTVHCYGNYLLSPWGDCSYPPTHGDIIRVTNLICDAIENTYNTAWACGNSCDVLYETSGTTSDWAFDVGVPLSWTPELRGNSFDPLPEQIPFSVAEVKNGLIALLGDINSRRA